MSNINEKKLRKYVTSLIKDVLSEDAAAVEPVVSTGTEPDPEGNDTSDSKELEEDVIEEAEFDCQEAGDCPEGQLCVDGVCADAPNPNPTDSPFGENWTRGNKDQLLFERLIKKWAK